MAAGKAGGSGSGSAGTSSDGGDDTSSVARAPTPVRTTTEAPEEEDLEAGGSGFSKLEKAGYTLADWRAEHCCTQVQPAASSD